MPSVWKNQKMPIFHKMPCWQHREEHSFPCLVNLLLGPRVLQLRRPLRPDREGLRLRAHPRRRHQRGQRGADKVQPVREQQWPAGAHSLL